MTAPRVAENKHQCKDNDKIRFCIYVENIMALLAAMPAWKWTYIGAHTNTRFVPLHIYVARSDSLQGSEQVYGAVCKLIIWTSFQRNILKLVDDVREG